MRADPPMIQLRLDLGQARVAAVRHCVLAGETQCQTKVLQFHEVDVPGRIAPRALQHVEEFLAGRSLPMQHDEERLRRPLALATPGCREHSLIERSAEHVARGERDLVGDP